MAHGLNTVVIKRSNNQLPKTEGSKGIGSRRIFAPQFKLQVLDSYRNDADCKGNQRATARKYGIHRRQIQKWLQVETNLRNSVLKIKSSSSSSSNNGIISSSQQVLKVNPDVNNMKCVSDVALSAHRLQDDTSPIVYSQHMNNSTEQPRVLPQMTEQRVPYINIPQARSPIVYSQPTSVNTTSSMSAPVCISPEVHRVPSSTGSPCTSTQYNILIDESHTNRCLPDNSTTAALDFSTHALNHHHHRQEYFDEESFMYEPPRYHPIDLSLKKCCSCPSPTPQYYYPPYPPSQPTYYTQVSPVELQHLRKDSEYEIWDLSMKNKPSLKRKFDEVVTSSNDDKNTIEQSSPPLVKKPVKLFKPYLDDDDYCSSSSSESRSSSLLKSEACYETSMLKKEGEIYDYRYLNNNIEYYNNYEYIPRHYSTEMEYLNNNNLIVKSNNHDSVVQTSPTNITINQQQHHVVNSSTAGTIKQRQSYSLNFKLSAIECYYNDDTCRGNQRAVASKYKIHRRQVQKWLKQEQELRDRFQSANEIQVS